MKDLVLAENRIFSIRSTQVMIDRDLAEMYGVETKVLNQAVKRNMTRFPDSFRFQLSDAEKDELVTNCDRFEKLKHSSKNPYAFTEQGVAMLSAVLRSDTAIKVSIAIMNAFVEIRKTIADHAPLLQLSQDFTKHKLDTDEKFKQVFEAIAVHELDDTQGIFFNGQTYEAYDFVNKLIKKAKTSIMVVDNYVDDTVITQLCKKKENVAAYLFTKRVSRQLSLDIARANTQYPTFKAIPFSDAHDRFLILDEKEIYHIGASLKDPGKRWFAFSKMNAESVVILNVLKELI